MCEAVMTLGGALRRVYAAPRAIPGYLQLLRRLRSKRVPIVMYHGVTATPMSVFNWCQLAVDRFEKQMAFLASEYRVLPLAEVVERLSRGAALPDRSTCITFDDGFRNVFTTAAPILERFQLPATVFLVSSLIGTRQPAWPERVYHAVTASARPMVAFRTHKWPLDSVDNRTRAYLTITEQLKTFPEAQKQTALSTLLEDLGEVAPIDASSPLATMNWEEIEGLARGGLVDFGSHTHTHPILARCSDSQQHEELRRSHDILYERLGAVPLFAYPNGTRADFTDVTKRLVAEAGYRCALSTVPGLNTARTDSFEMRRVNVGADMTHDRFEAAMIGL